MKSRSIFVFLIVSILTSVLYGQHSDTMMRKAVAAIVELDSVVITATKQGFDVEDFIGLVQNDKSLYRAFKNLRSAEYSFQTKMSFIDRKGREEAAYSSLCRQFYREGCREMQIFEEKDSGRFFRKRKRKYRYYTAALYDRVFVTHGRECGQSEERAPTGSMDKTGEHISELKKLIFTPGRDANVPLIGSKTEIFSDKMIDRYDFHIRSDEHNGVPVYVFEAVVRDEYTERVGKTVFRKLITWFAKTDFQVVARQYHMAHNTLLYMFDVRMYVDLERKNNKYFPVRVQYDGEWNIPGRRKERGTFIVSLFDFS